MPSPAVGFLRTQIIETGTTDRLRNRRESIKIKPGIGLLQSLRVYPPQSVQLFFSICPLMAGPQFWTLFVGAGGGIRQKEIDLWLINCHCCSSKMQAHICVLAYWPLPSVIISEYSDARLSPVCLA